MLPGLSTYTKDELSEERKRAETDPNFNMAAVHAFGDNMWLFGVYPQTFDNAKAEM